MKYKTPQKPWTMIHQVSTTKVDRKISVMTFLYIYKELSQGPVRQEEVVRNLGYYCGSQWEERRNLGYYCSNQWEESLMKLTPKDFCIGAGFPKLGIFFMSADSFKL